MNTESQAQCAHKKLPFVGTERIWFAITIVIAVIMYIPTFQYLWGRWLADQQYSLAYLVPFISGYFLWKKWPEAKALDRSPTLWGLVIICVGLMLHLAGVVLDVNGPSGLSIIILIVGGCLYFHSVQLLKTLAFPIAYTFFMIPIPGGIIDRVGFPMQLLATKYTAKILSLLGIDVVEKGVNLSIDGFDFKIAQECSGMSSLVALVGVVAVFAYITRLPTVYKWVLFLLSLPIALAANVMRITTIALIGYQWGSDVAIGIFHDWSSPMLFMAAVLLLLGINWGFEWISNRGNRTTSS